MPRPAVYDCTMRTSFHRIAYEALEVCNPLRLEAIEDAIEAAGLAPGSRALDIGAGNGRISILLADRFGLAVEAVELDPAMAMLAAERIAAAEPSIALHREPSWAVLGRSAPYDLIVAIGTTEPSAPGVRDPQAMLAGLARQVAEGGIILWGDLFWIGAPPEPLRQIVEMANTYESHEGWQAAARAAGLVVRQAALSDNDSWAHYTATMDAAARAWLAENPDAPEATAVRVAADRVKAMLEFGRPYLGFGLYLLEKPAG